jgi:hypothetical protein
MKAQKRLKALRSFRIIGINNKNIILNGGTKIRII